MDSLCRNLSNVAKRRETLCAIYATCNVVPDTVIREACVVSSVFSFGIGNSNPTGLTSIRLAEAKFLIRETENPEFFPVYDTIDPVEQGVLGLSMNVLIRISSKHSVSDLFLPWIDQLYNLVSHSFPKVRMKACWCIANLMIESEAFHFAMVSRHSEIGLRMVLNLVGNRSKSMESIVTWALTTFLYNHENIDETSLTQIASVLQWLFENNRKKSTLAILSSVDPIQVLCPMFQVIDSWILLTSINAETDRKREFPALRESNISRVSCAIWCLSKRTTCSTSFFSRCLAPYVIETKFKYSSIVLPCLQVIGNLVYGSNTNDVLIYPDAVNMFARMLYDAEPGCTIAQEACWIISNIAAGETHHAAALANLTSLIPDAIYRVFLHKGHSLDLLNEASYVLFNLATTEESRSLTQTFLGYFALIDVPGVMLSCLQRIRWKNTNKFKAFVRRVLFCVREMNAFSRLHMPAVRAVISKLREFGMASQVTNIVDMYLVYFEDPELLNLFS